jgi:ankyrin repeat protein
MKLRALTITALLPLIYSCNPTDRTRPASIFESTLNHDVAALREYLDKGGDPNAVEPQTFETLLPRAAVSCDVVEVDLLLRHGASVTLKSSKQQAPILNCTMGMEVTRRLIDAGAEINASDALGVTPLHCRAHALLKDQVRLLLQHGADPTRRTSRLVGSRTPAQSGVGAHMDPQVEHTELAPEVEAILLAAERKWEKEHGGG